mgnify:CR=1 FL=1|jgi:hypothetical protein
MKIFITNLILIILLLSCQENNKEGTDNFPIDTKIKNLDKKNGFRNYKFNMESYQIIDASWLKEEPYKIKDNNFGYTIYSKSFSDLKIDKHNIDRIELAFINNKLENIEIMFKCINCFGLKNILDIAYGFPNGLEDQNTNSIVFEVWKGYGLECEKSYWIGEKVRQILTICDYNNYHKKLSPEKELFKPPPFTLLKIQLIEFNEHLSQIKALKSTLNDSLKKKRIEESIINDL